MKKTTWNRWNLVERSEPVKHRCIGPQKRATFEGFMILKVVHLLNFSLRFIFLILIRLASFPIATLPKTNIAPTNGWLEYYFPIGEAYFQGLR